MEQPIENKVAKSGLTVLDIAELVRDVEQPEVFDLKDYLWQGLALREKDFRQALKEADWSRFDGRVAVVYCSADAIVPHWAFMLTAMYLEPHAARVYFGSADAFNARRIEEKIDVLDIEPYRDARVMVKGCGDESVDFAAYGYLALRLKPIVKTLMFGEPCSAVPVYKRPR